MKFNCGFIILPLIIDVWIYAKPMENSNPTITTNEESEKETSARKSKRSFIPELNILRENYAAMTAQTLSDGSIVCDGYKCPSATVKCVIERKPADNNIFMNRSRKCLNQNGHAIDYFVTIEYNATPHVAVKTRVEHTKDSQDMEVSGSMSNLLPETEAKRVYVG